VRFYPIGVAVMAALLVACSANNNGKKPALTAVGDTGRATVAAGVASPAAAVDPTLAATSAPTASPSPVPTATRPPTPSPTPAPQALQIEAKGYGQSRMRVGWGFVVTNPNSLAAQRSQYQVAAFDANGTVLTTDQGYIEVIAPGQRVGIAGDLFLKQGEQIARMDVQVKTGDLKNLPQQGALSAEGATYKPDQFLPRVTGLVKSTYAQDLKNVEVFAIAYDADSAIIGGGLAFVQFVPASGQTAVEASLTASATPAKVELFPIVTILSGN